MHMLVWVWEGGCGGVSVNWWVHVCLCVWLRACVVCMCVCMCACMCADTCVHARQRDNKMEPSENKYLFSPLSRGGGLGSRPKKMYRERLGDGVEYHLMSPTPRR